MPNQSPLPTFCFLLCLTFFSSIQASDKGSPNPISTNNITILPNPESDRTTEQQQKSSTEDQNKTTVSPQNEITPEVAQYLNIWETKCLADVNFDLSTTSEHGGKIMDVQRGDNQEDLDPFADLEREALKKFDFINKIDVKVFLESIKTKTSIRIFDLNFSQLLIFLIIFVALLIFSILVIGISLCTGLKNKLLKRRLKCIKCCIAFEVILVVIIALLLFGGVCLHK